jgi:NAD(P)-dependent dehydrogenase (short-subunit alcohol dehydrogenase family)
VAIVTGAGRNIGEQIAKLFADERAARSGSAGIAFARGRHAFMQVSSSCKYRRRAQTPSTQVSAQTRTSLGAARHSVRPQQQR